MGRRQLIDEVREVLTKTGFYLSERHDQRGLSFDVVARRDDLLLLLKVLQNVDAFSKANADELRLIATTLEGSPIVVGERSGSGPLEGGVIYSRFGVPIVSKQTFVDPFAYTRETGQLLKGFEAFERFEQDVFRKLQTLGYSVLPTVRCPFEAFASRESLFLTGVPAKGERIEDKARIVANISSVVEKDAVLFVEVQTAVESIDGTPLI